MSWLPCNWDNVQCHDYKAFVLESGDYDLWSCNRLRTNTSACASTANPDISGYGVLIAFFITGVLTFICAWAMLIFDATYKGDDKRSLSLLDRRFIWAIGRFFKQRPSDSLADNRPKTSKGQLLLQKLIIALSDGHLLTGLAIVIAGFSQACRLTIYHYHVVVYLAWTSSSVHLVALTISRHWLRRNKLILVVRLVVMSILFVLLFVALLLTGSATWPTNYQGRFTYDTNVVCTWMNGNLDHFRSDTIVALIVLSLGYVCRMAKVFESTSDICRKWLRTMPEDALKSAFKHCETCWSRAEGRVLTVFWHLLGWLTLASYLYLRAFYDIYESLLVEVIWGTLALLWGFAEVFSWHSMSPLNASERQWSFGQILPVLLIAGPLLSLPEIYHDSKREAEQEMKKLRQKDIELIDRSSYEANAVQPILRSPRTFWTETTLMIDYSRVKTDVNLLDRRNQPYRSACYNILLILVFLAGLAFFSLIVFPKFQVEPGEVNNDTDLQDTVQEWFSHKLDWLALWIPIFCGPGILWFLFMAPLSKTIREVLGHNASTASLASQVR